MQKSNEPLTNQEVLMILSSLELDLIEALKTNEF